jgi:hypothetical protein
MRLAGLILIGALGLSVAAASAHAAPIVSDVSAPQHANIIRVAEGCGFGWHRNYWDDCVPNRFRAYRHRPDYIIEEWDEYDE